MVNRDTVGSTEHTDHSLDYAPNNLPWCPPVLPVVPVVSEPKRVEPSPSESNQAPGESNQVEPSLSGRVDKRPALSARGERAQASRTKSNGERGIRTPDRVSPIHAFQACAFNHSATSPKNFQTARDNMLSVGGCKLSQTGLWQEGKRVQPTVINQI